LLAGWAQVKRFQRVASIGLDEMWHRKLGEVGARLGVARPVKLLQSALVEVPTVIGWLRPMILLPAGCVVGLTPGQLESILAHELAHIRRHDYLVNLLQSAVETLLFYHPVVWWVSRQVREERENCCDDLAVAVCGDSIAYARALATLEELRHAPAQLALAASGAPLLQRIRRLVGQSGRAENAPAWPVAGVILLLVIAPLACAVHGNRAVAPESKRSTMLAANTVKVPLEANISTNPDTLGEAHLKNNPTLTPVEKSWTRDQNSGETVIKTNPFVRASAPNTGKGRQEITDKLNTIRLDSVKYDGLPLTEVLHNLAELSQRNDPDKKGVNFFFNRREPPTAAANEVFIERPATALTPEVLNPNVIEAPRLPFNQTDATSVTVKILPGLSNVRLMDVLNAITQTSSPPVKYWILDYAVLFSLRGPGSATLETRTFHLDPNRFSEGLNAISAAAIEIQLADLKFQRELLGRNLRPEDPQITKLDELINKSQAVLANVSDRASSRQMKSRAFIKSAGVDMDTNNPANAGKVVVWNDRAGILTVRAEPKELDLVEAEVAKSNSLAPTQHTETNGAAVPDAPKPGQATTNSANGANLSRRIFSLDPNNFAIVLERTTGISFNNSPAAVHVQPGTNGSLFVGVTNGTSPEKVVALSFETAFRQYLASAGVDFDTNNPANAGKAIAWDNRTSSLVVSASAEDMKKVQGALEIICQAPPEVNFKIQFVSLDEAASKKPLWFRTYSGTNLTGSSNLGDSSPRRTLPGNGILTAPQYKATLAALSQWNGAIVPDALQLTTSDNRICQVKTDDMTGQILDLTPHISSNKESIELALAATLSEYGMSEFVRDYKDADWRTPMPNFHAKTFTNRATVPDGQTLVLGYSNILKTNTPVGKLSNGNHLVTNGNLFIFVTPTLIYPDGTLVHPDFVSHPPQEPALPGSVPGEPAK
jgi:hypothetical protein